MSKATVYFVGVVTGFVLAWGAFIAEAIMEPGPTDQRAYPMYLMDECGTGFHVRQQGESLIDCVERLDKERRKR